MKTIECQGEQHYKPFDFFGGKKMLDYQINRDRRKLKLCEEHEIKMIYFSDKKYSNEVITDKKELLKEIKNE